VVAPPFCNNGQQLSLDLTEVLFVDSKGLELLRTLSEIQRWIDPVAHRFWPSSYLARNECVASD